MQGTSHVKLTQNTVHSIYYKLHIQEQEDDLWYARLSTVFLSIIFCSSILHPWQLNSDFSLLFLIRCNLRIYQSGSNSAREPLTPGKRCWPLTLLFSVMLAALISALMYSLCSSEALILFSWSETIGNKLEACWKVSVHWPWTGLQCWDEFSIT